MKIAAVTQKGPNKTENEDRIVIGKSIISNGLYECEFKNGVLAVADGVGGNKAGAVASQYIAEKIIKEVELSAEIMKDWNIELITKSNTNEGLKGMATTLAGVCIGSKESQLFSIGNSRVYILQAGRYLKQLTVDDTVLNYYLSIGKISNEGIDTFERKNEITACFGGGNTDLFRIEFRDIAPITAPIMITSDGIHDYINIDQMEEIFDNYGFTEKACNMLINQARENGSRDDASVILVNI